MRRPCNGVAVLRGHIQVLQVRVNFRHTDIYTSMYAHTNAHKVPRIHLQE